jgi:hypothetical protein
MKKRILFAITGLVFICQILPGMVVADSGFSVAPARLEVTVPENGSSHVYIYIYSQFDGEIAVGTEDIPFRVEPERIAVNSTDKNKKVELIIHGDPALEAGEYAGKLTFLGLTGKNVAYGVKIDVRITQIREPTGVVAESEPGGMAPGMTETEGQSYLIIVIAAVIAVLIALGIGILVGRRLRR